MKTSMNSVQGEHSPATYWYGIYSNALSWAKRLDQRFPVPLQAPSYTAPAIEFTFHFNYVILPSGVERQAFFPLPFHVRRILSGADFCQWRRTRGGGLRRALSRAVLRRLDP
jgi:hypothetical protein